MFLFWINKCYFVRHVEPENNCIVFQSYYQDKGNAAMREREAGGMHAVQSFEHITLHVGMADFLHFFFSLIQLFAALITRYIHMMQERSAIIRTSYATRPSSEFFTLHHTCFQDSSTIAHVAFVLPTSH